MPQRRKTSLLVNEQGAPRGSFRQRYNELEHRRTELVRRMSLLGEHAREHPAYKRALTLINATFRKSKVAQRLAILQAAAWLIDVLERLTTLG